MSRYSDPVHMEARVRPDARGGRRRPTVDAMAWNDNVISEFRAGNARVADTFDRDNLLLLHTTGARSGQERVSPVAVFTLGDDPVIVASAAGSPKNPDWYANLVADPQVQVERWQDGELVTSEVTAQVVPEGPEHDALWADVVKWSPGFGDYQTKTTRVIPLIRLLPRS